MAHRLRLDRIEHPGAPGHAAGMPVLQHAPGDEDKRVFVIRTLIRLDDFAGHEQPAPALARKLVHEHHPLAGIPLFAAGPDYGVLALQALPGDAGDAGHGLAHLGKYIGRAAVVPVQTDAACQLLDDPQVLAHFSRWIQRLAPKLHQPIRIGERAGLFGIAGCRQHNVGKGSGFGQEQILDHQMVELGQGGTHVRRFRVGHGRILAHDVHAADLAVMDGVRDLGRGQPWLRVQLAAPQRFETLPCRGILDALVVREGRGHQADVGCSLDVVLSANRVQPGARAPDLASEECQRNQATRIVGAVLALRDAHAPDDHRSAGRGVQARDLLQRFRRNATDRRHGLRAVGLDVALEIVEPFGAIADEFLVGQPFLDDGVDHRVEQGHVRVGLELQVDERAPRKVLLTRVGHDQLEAVAIDGVLDPGGRDRVIDGRVGADEEDHL